MTPGFDQGHDAIGTHLAVNAQVLPVVERLEHGIGDAADAQLQGRAIGDQGGYVAGDASLYVGGRDERQFKQRSGRLDHGGDFIDVQEGIAERTGASGR